MCLNTVDKKEITEKIKNSIPEEGLTVYKLVSNAYYGIKDGKYHSLYQRTATPFETGINKANTMYEVEVFERDPKTNLQRTYKAGFHFWLKKEDAEKYREYLHKIREYRNEEVTVIECKIKKEWITATGMNAREDKIYARTIITNEAIFPIFAEKEE